MSIQTRVVAALVALAWSAGLAIADTAAVERSAKLRSGPGSQYRALAVVRRGAVVDLSGCTANWCEVSWRGRRGYLALSVLGAARSPAAIVTAPPPSYYVAPGPSYYYDDYPGFDYPGYAYAPNVSTSPAPRSYHRSGRWSGRHFWRGSAGWAGRQGPVGSAGTRPQIGAAPPPVTGGSVTTPRATDGATTGSIKSAVTGAPSVAAPPASTSAGPRGEN